MGIPEYRELYKQLLTWEKTPYFSTFMQALRKGSNVEAERLAFQRAYLNDVKTAQADKMTPNAIEKMAVDQTNTVEKTVTLFMDLIRELPQRLFAQTWDMYETVVKEATRQVYCEAFSDAMGSFTVKMQEKPEFLRKAVFQDLRNREITLNVCGEPLKLYPEQLITANDLNNPGLAKAIQKAAGMPEQVDPAEQNELKQLIQDYGHGLLWDITKAFISRVKPTLDTLRKTLTQQFSTVLDEKAEQFETLAKGAFGQPASIYTSDLIVLGRKFGLEKSQSEKRSPGPNGDTAPGPDGVQKTGESRIDQMFDQALGVHKKNTYRGKD